MRHRIIAVPLLWIAILTSIIWTGEGWAQTTTRRVGIVSTPVLTGTADEAIRQYYEPLRRAIAQGGWIEDKHVSYEYRSARSSPPQFAEAVADLVRLKVDVIFADSAPAIRTAYAATRSIPIVGVDFTNDPVAAGYADSYSRPGRNLTGFFLDAPDFAGKWLETLKAIIPSLSRVAVIWDPNPGATHLHAVQESARSLGVQLQILEVRKVNDLDKAFSAFRPKPQALIILPSPMTWGQSPRIAELAMKHRLPAISMAYPFTAAGGLLSYGPDRDATQASCGRLVSKILNGAKPADLPVERPTKFNFTVNLKTAKAMGLTVPDFVLVSADKVIR